MAVNSGYQGLIGPTRATGTGILDNRSSGEGALIVDSASGQYAVRTYMGSVHFFAVAAVTVPVNAATLGSVFGIYNPPGSGRILEIIDTSIGQATATTVVQEFVWVSSTVALSALATFTTAGSARNRRMQDAPTTVARVYTAATHSGTPNVEAKIGSFAKVTSDQGLITAQFNGTLMIPPGVLAAVCTLTAASAGSSTNIAATWADIPL